MATETTGAEEAATGLPQLDFSTFPNQIFWLIVTLVAIYLILNRVALPRIGSVLAERAGTITNDIAAAEELKLKAQEAEAAYDKALADARAEAQRIAGETKAAIQADLDVAIEKADAEIAAKAADLRDPRLSGCKEWCQTESHWPSSQYGSLAELRTQLQTLIFGQEKRLAQNTNYGY